MAKSNDEELLRMIAQQQKKNLQAQQQATNAQMQAQQQTWTQSYYTTNSQMFTIGNGSAGVAGPTGGGGGGSAGTWSAVYGGGSSTTYQQRVGPFNHIEYLALTNKEGGDCIQFEVEKNLVTNTDEYYMVIAGSVNPAKKPKDPKELGDYQEAYDKGYEDGLKRA